MKDCKGRKGCRLYAIPFMMMAMSLCSFQCSDALSLMSLEDAEPEIELMKKKEIPIWTVYLQSDNLPETNIFFVVWNLTEQGNVWAECPNGDLEVSVFPVCSRFTLSVKAKENFTGSSSVTIKAINGGVGDEQEIIIEAGRIALSHDEAIMPAEGGTDSISVDSNMKLFVTTYDDWIQVSIDGDKVTFNISENTSDSDRTGKIIVHDIYEVVSEELTIFQEKR